MTGLNASNRAEVFLPPPRAAGMTRMNDVGVRSVQIAMMN
jgi:hypothetical protein